MMDCIISCLPIAAILVVVGAKDLEVGVVMFGERYWGYHLYMCWSFV